MKSIRIIARTENINEQDTTCNTRKGTIKSKEEDWSIVASSHNLAGEERELAEITVSFPDGSKWVGSIQDLRAIGHYAKNALTDLKQANEEFPYVFQPESIDEVEQLLSHFKK